MPRVFLFAVLLLLLQPGHAVICKQVDAQGVVSYSDLPADECPQPVQLPDYSRYAPRPIVQEEGKVPGLPPKPVDDGAPFLGYERFLIDSPEDGSSVHDEGGRLDVYFKIEPDLRAGHLINLILDGRELQPPLSASSGQIGNVERGRHSLRAVIVDAQGKPLAESQLVTFFMHRMTEAEREAANRRGEQRLTEEQLKRKAQLEKERREVKEQTEKDIRQQRQHQEAQRRSDFTAEGTTPIFEPAGPDTSSSPAYPELPRAASPDQERYRSEAERLKARERERSSRHPRELKDYEPTDSTRNERGEPQELDYRGAPRSGKIPQYPRGKHPAYTPPTPQFRAPTRK
ncbi:MAG: DUF4124 domain-containing protein [Gammaproteobacteria bacterium]|nr:MAG: DUF4124 domain-containing protein [Gammaproteobacteria bacterium]